MDDLYQENILDHFQNPRNKGELAEPRTCVYETNASCGDEITIFIKTKKKDQQNQITNIKWQGSGCVISQASVSLLTEKILAEKLNLKQLLELGETDMLELLGLEKISTGRKKCLLLSLQAIKKSAQELK